MSWETANLRMQRTTGQIRMTHGDSPARPDVPAHRMRVGASPFTGDEG